MKKIVGVVGVIVVILGVIFGYKIVYKASPRDFITKDTRLIYVNEGINNKDFLPVLSLIDDPEMKEKLNSNIKNLKYVSKVYLFSDKEFYEMSEKSFTGVIDTRYWYFLMLKEIDKYFDLVNGTYILKKDIKDKYFPNLGTDVFMKNYKGLFIVSLGEKNLKDFIAKDGKYLYNKEIENTLDTKRDNLLGTFIYNNSGTGFYGINLISNSATIDNDSILSEGEIIIDEQDSGIYKNSKEDRELVKYVEKNDIYISVDDFSRLDRIIFNPLILGANVDSQAIFAIWKNLLGIDIEEILKEIDGEVIFRFYDMSFMIKVKSDAPEIRRVLTLLKDENSAFYVEKRIKEIEKNILVIGDGNFKENSKPYQINREVFLFGEIDSPEIMGVEGMESSIVGENEKIIMKNKISVELFKELINEY